MTYNTSRDRLSVSGQSTEETRPSDARRAITPVKKGTDVPASQLSLVWWDRFGLLKPTGAH